MIRTFGGLAGSVVPAVILAFAGSVTATAAPGSSARSIAARGFHGATTATHHPGRLHQALRWPTRARPLRLLITGDSLPGFLGPQVLSQLAPSGRVRGWTDVHNATGLTRPDFVDWSLVARQQVARFSPEATVVLLGGNDFQNMVLSNGHVLIAGTAAWTREYARRVAVCMRIWTEGQATRRVYWLSLPPARNPAWAFDFAQIDQAIRSAARQVPGARYLDVLGPITLRGRYTDYVTIGGQPTLIRESDGVHLNMAGSQLVANEVVPVLRHDWHIGR